MEFITIWTSLGLFLFTVVTVSFTGYLVILGMKKLWGVIKNRKKK